MADFGRKPRSGASPPIFSDRFPGSVRFFSIPGSTISSVFFLNALRHSILYLMRAEDVLLSVPSSSTSQPPELDVWGNFRIFIRRYSILSRCGNCSGWPGDLVPGPWGSIPGRGGGSEGSGGAPNLKQIYICIAIQTSATHRLEVFVFFLIERRSIPMCLAPCPCPLARVSGGVSETQLESTVEGFPSTTFSV